MERAQYFGLEANTKTDDDTMVTPTDIRAQHCKTTEEYMLWKYSSNYQSSKGGEQDLHNEVGIHIEDDDFVSK